MTVVKTKDALLADPIRTSLSRLTRTKSGVRYLAEIWVPGRLLATKVVTGAGAVATWVVKNEAIDWLRSEATKWSGVLNRQVLTPEETMRRYPNDPKPARFPH